MKFKIEDFIRHKEEYLQDPDYFDYMLEMANIALEKKLADAPVVYKFANKDGTYTGHKLWDEDKKDHDTHKAKLVCIRALKE